MKICVCIGSSCHIKGSRQVIEILQQLIKDNNLAGILELSGTFCMGNCQNGVCVRLEDKVFSLTPENTPDFFNIEVLGVLP